MPSLDFKGKSFVYTHHLGVPYRELNVVADKSCPAQGKKADLDDNLIIHGDNLDALKALLPRYAGKVDCIYIDPPYNTGNEGWCYNDKVNSPLMREWIKKSANPVDREDLQRHDKWLSMMFPRLSLLKELLAEDGAIFVSIDDNEVHRLRALMDEIFGEDNFVASIIWQKNYSPKNTAKYFSEDHDFILSYAKQLSAWKPALLARTDEQDSAYKNPDNDPRGPWKPGDLSARNSYSEGVYPITCTGGRVITGPPQGRYWIISKTKFQEWNNDNRIWYGRDGNSVPQVKKFLSEVKQGRVPQTLWFYDDVGHTDESKKEVKQIVGFESREEGTITPKPTRLINRILEIATDKNSIVLDSFAGSGTTAHAVLALNKKDGGNRRFILCETEDYADTLTAERVRRVIKGYKYEGTAETELYPPEKITWTTFSKDTKRIEILERIAGFKALEGSNYDKIETKITDGVLSIVGQKQITEKMPCLGGSFAYVELGEAMDLERLLAEEPGTLPSFQALARYLFFTATGHTLPEDEQAPKGKGKESKGKDSLEEESFPVLIGETPQYRLYLNYKEYEGWLRNPSSALTRKQAEEIAKKRDEEAPEKSVLIYAPSKYISHKALREMRVEFAQLPYALHRVQSA